MHGTVDANRNIISGDGFVVKPGLTGVHRVVFTEAFVSPPTVLATLRKGGERGTLSVESVDTGMFDVRTATNGVWTSLGFSFMAVGSRRRIRNRLSGKTKKLTVSFDSWRYA